MQKVEKKEGIGRLKFEPPFSLSQSFKDKAKGKGISQTDFFVEVYRFYLENISKKS